MSTLTGTWTKLASSDDLRRSSHSLAGDSGTVYLFGGELAPRQPRDSEVYKLSLSADQAGLDVNQVTAAKPTARVGATLTALNGNLYCFSGRGGIDMKPLDERGSLQVYSIARSTWTVMSPADSRAAVPEPRSYHCATTDGKQRIFIHAGCPEKGRLRDLWSFDVKDRAWTKHADAPGAPRGGTSIVYANNKLWRMNGFDGQHEIGGFIDVFDLTKDTWSTVEFVADGKTGPGARSVSALLAADIDSRIHLVTMFGEADPSSLGHAGAGKMLSDAWAFDTHASVWKKIQPKTEQVPQPRGWFDATAVSPTQIVVTGGLADTNERIGDAWLLTVA